MVSHTPTLRRRRATVHTLGGRLNQAEAFLIRDRLEHDGYEIVPFGEPADLAIINTCTVTNLAEAKCRQAIRAFTRGNPGAFTAIVGCYAQSGARDIAAIPGVDLVLGNNDKLQVLDFVAGGKNEHPMIIRDRIDHSDFSISFVGDLPFNKRANLKVQDGCDFVCSFCIIPRVRGPARARKLPNLLEEARSLARRGVRELVLTGVKIGTYDHDGADIVAVVDELARIPGVDRIRISSVEPTTIPDGLLDRMAEPGHPLLPFLHVPMQSACDRILARMRRRHTVDEFLEFARDATARIADVYFGTDLLVGFPGETTDEFEETLRVFNEGPFAFGHVFSYSERHGRQGPCQSNRPRATRPGLYRLRERDAPRPRVRPLVLKAISAICEQGRGAASISPNTPRLRIRAGIRPFEEEPPESGRGKRLNFPGSSRPGIKAGRGKSKNRDGMEQVGQSAFFPVPVEWFKLPVGTGRWGFSAARDGAQPAAPPSPTVPAAPTVPPAGEAPADASGDENPAGKILSVYA